MFGCQDISIMIEKRTRKFLQKLALSNSVVWTVCRSRVCVKGSIIYCSTTWTLDSLHIVPYVCIACVFVCVCLCA